MYDCTFHIHFIFQPDSDVEISCQGKYEKCKFVKDTVSRQLVVMATFLMQLQPRKKVYGKHMGSCVDFLSNMNTCYLHVKRIFCVKFVS